MELKPLRDCIGPEPLVLFVGINPGVRSSLTGHHFAGYSNRFWKLLYESRIVPEPMTYRDDRRLPEWGYAITNIVPRPTPGIDTITPAEYVAGRTRLVRKIARVRPRLVAPVGVTVHRALFPASARTPLTLGLQRQTIDGARVFVLPNPSGRNANYSYREMLEAFERLGRVIQRMRRDAQRSGNMRAARRT
jgi:TDG/mug DNA glycosylase family protein